VVEHGLFLLADPLGLELESTVFVITGMLGFTRCEVEARGGDVAFVLGLAPRRRAH
jgi:hypothetical protein